MSAEIVGAALVGLPLIGLAAAVVIAEGWDCLGAIVAALLGCLAISGVMTFGVYLMTEGWPS